VAAAPLLPERALAVLKEVPDAVVACQGTSLAISLIVPQADLKRSVELLHREFFRQVDPAVFVESPAEPLGDATRLVKPAIKREQRIRLLLTLPTS
jgi:hypothetical protein